MLANREQKLLKIVQVKIQKLSKLQKEVSYCEVRPIEIKISSTD